MKQQFSTVNNSFRRVYIIYSLPVMTSM